MRLTQLNENHRTSNTKCPGRFVSTTTIESRIPQNLLENYANDGVLVRI